MCFMSLIRRGGDSACVEYGRGLMIGVFSKRHSYMYASGMIGIGTE
jgi:hypothetical protein